MRTRTVIKGLVVVVAGLVVAAVAIVSSIDVNRYKGDVSAEVKAATGRDLVIDGDLGLNVSLTPAFTVSGIRFANAPWGSRPDMAVLGRASVEVELLPLLFGDIRVRRLVLQDLDLLLETDAAGQGNWQLGKTESAREGGGALPEVSRVVFRNITVTWRDGRTGTSEVVRLDRFDARSAGNAENAENGSGGPLEIGFALAYGGEKIEGSGRVGSLRALAAGGKPYPVRLAVEAAGGRLAIAGTIARPLEMTGLDLEVSFSGEQLDRIGKIAKINLPAVGYRLSGKLLGSPQRLALNGLQVSVGKSNLSGDVQVGLAGRRPRIDAALSSSLIDLDALLPVTEKSERTVGKEKKKRVFDDTPLRLDGFSALDALVRLNAGSIRAGGVVAEGVGLTAELKAGVLAVKPFAAGFSGGRVAGDAVLDTRGGTARLRSAITVEGLDVGRLLKDGGVADEVSGSIDGDLSISATGASVRELMAGLDGRVSVIGGKGRINNTALDILSADVLGTLAPFLGKRDGTAINCMVARLDIENGVAAVTAMIFDTETLTIAGSGRIDLGEETLDITLTPRPKKTSLLNLATPILVTGTLAAPSVIPDPAGLARKAAGIALTTVNPLVAIVPLVMDAVAGDGNNPCLAAVEQAKSKTKPKTKPKTKNGPVPQARDTKGQGGLGGFIKGLGEGLDKALKGQEK